KYWSTAIGPTSSACAKRQATRCATSNWCPEHAPPQQCRDDGGVNRDLGEVVLADAHPEEMQDAQARDGVDEFVQGLPARRAQGLHRPIERRRGQRREQHEGAES